MNSPTKTTVKTNSMDAPMTIPLHSPSSVSSSQNQQLDKIVTDTIATLGPNHSFNAGTRSSDHNHMVIQNFEGLSNGGPTNSSQQVIMTTQSIPMEKKTTVTKTVKRYYQEGSGRTTAKETQITEEEYEDAPQTIVQQPVLHTQAQQIFHGTTYHGPVRSKDPTIQIIREIGVNKKVIGTEVIPLSQRYIQPGEFQQQTTHFANQAQVQFQTQQAQVQQAVQQKQVLGYQQTHTDRVLYTTPPVYQTILVPGETSCWKRCFGYQPSCCSYGGCCGPDRCCPGAAAGGGCLPCCNGPCCAGCTLI